MSITQRSWLSRNAQALAAAVAVIAVAAVLLFAQDDSASGSTYTTDQAVTYQEFAGTIRNTGSGWYILDDAGHTPDDLSSIGTVTSTSVRVNYPGCAEITSVIVGPDDTYAKDYGASFGASVGLTYMVITGSINDSSDSGTAQDVWDPTTDYSSSSNIWIMGRCIPAA